MHISCIIRGIEKKFGSYMRTRVMEYAQGYYNHEEETHRSYMSGWEMLRQSLMGEETGKSL
jgi:hypothetical protein